MNATHHPTENLSTGDLEQLFEQTTVYHHIGLDSEGRAHFYAPESNEIVVTATDRRGRGVRGETDIVERIPVGERSIAQYCAFVREHVDGLEWAELDIPEAGR